MNTFYRIQRLAARLGGGFRGREPFTLGSLKSNRVCLALGGGVISTVATGCFGPIPPSSAGRHEAEYVLVVDKWSDAPADKDERAFRVSQNGRTRLQEQPKVVLRTPDNCGALQIGQFNCEHWVTSLTDKLKTAGITLEPYAIYAAALAEKAAEEKEAEAAQKEAELAAKEAVVAEQESDIADKEDAAAAKQAAAAEETVATEQNSAANAEAEAAAGDNATDDSEKLVFLDVEFIVSASVVSDSRSFFLSDAEATQLKEAKLKQPVAAALTQRVDEVRAGKKWRPIGSSTAQFIAVHLSVADSLQSDAPILATYSSGFQPASGRPENDSLKVLFGLKKVGLNPELTTRPDTDWVVVTPDSWRVPAAVEAEIKEEAAQRLGGPLAAQTDEMIDLFFAKKAETP